MLLLIDGNNSIWRNYYTHKFLTAYGRPTGGIFGMLLSVKLLREQFKGSKIIVAWDSRSNVRKKIDPTYKDNRKENPDRDKVIRQIPTTERALSLLGISSVKQEGLEADDLMAILAKGKRAMLVTNDEDMYQVLSSNVSMFKPTSETVYNLQHFKAAFQIEPENWPLVLALAGKSSNNIPGVKGVGLKNAIKFIRQEKVTDRIADLIATCLDDGTVERYVNLTTIPIIENYYPKAQRQIPNREAFRKLCVELKFSAILKGFKDWERLFFTTV